MLISTNFTLIIVLVAFPVTVIKVLSQKQLKEEWFYFDIIVQAGGEVKAIRSLKQLVTSYPQSGEQ